MEPDDLSAIVSLPNRKVVDWVMKGPIKMITLNALIILKSAGRLQ